MIPQFEQQRNRSICERTSSPSMMQGETTATDEYLMSEQITQTNSNNLSP